MTENDSQAEIKFRENGTLLFKNCSHPEKFAWIFIFTKLNKKFKKFAIVTDHDLGNPLDFNERKRPVVGETYVPETCSLLYASSDKKNDGLMNSLIAKCDDSAKKL